MVLRALFLLLILGNLILFAISRGYLGGEDDGREPERLANQLHPEKLRIVAPAPKPPAPVPQPVIVPEAPASEAAAAEVPATPCPRPGDPATSHWVNIPDLANRAAAEKKSAELRKLGINDFHILDAGGDGKFAISLGVFENQEAAAEFLGSLGKKGVRSARITPRTRPPGDPAPPGTCPQ